MANFPADTRAYMKVGDEWVELPRTETGFAIDPTQVLHNGETLTIKTVYAHSGPDNPDTPIYASAPIPVLPDGAIIDLMEWVVPRYPVSDEEE